MIFYEFLPCSWALLDSQAEVWQVMYRHLLLGILMRKNHVFAGQHGRDGLGFTHAAIWLNNYQLATLNLYRPCQMTRPPFVSWSDFIHNCSLTPLRRPRGDSRSQRLAWGLWMPSELEKSILLEEFESPRRGRFWSESWWDDKNRFVFGRRFFRPLKTGGFLKTMRVLLFGQDFQFDSYFLRWVETTNQRI